VTLLDRARALGQHPVLAALPAAVRIALAERARPIDLIAGAAVAVTAEQLLLVLTGEVTLGSRRAGPGALLGLGDALADRRVALAPEVTAAGAALRLPRDATLDLVSDHPAAVAALLALVAAMARAEA
jgi:CRP-like cAMP-binding protein